MRRWMMSSMKLLDDILGKTSLINRGIFEPQAVQELIQSNLTGRVDASYTLFNDKH